MLVTVYDRKQEKNENEKGLTPKMYRIIRHCDKCNQDLLGVWRYYTKKGELIYPRSSGEYFVDAFYIEEGNKFVKFAKEHEYNYEPSKQIAKVRKEVEGFISMHTCPLCGETLLNSEDSVLKIGHNWEKEKVPVFPNDPDYKDFCNVQIGDKFKRHTRVSHGNGLPGYNMESTEANELVKTDVNSAVFFIYDDINSILDFFHRNRISNLENKAETKISELEIKCKNIEELKFSKIEDIKEDPKKLRQFIKNTIQIETDIYLLKARLKELYVACSTAQWDADGFEIVTKYRTQKEVDDIKLTIECLRCNGEKMIPPNEVSVEYPEQPSKPIKELCPEKPSTPELKKSNIFNKKKIDAENETALQSYNEECKQYEEKCRKIEEQFTKASKKYEEKLHLYEQAMARFVQSRRELYESRLADAEHHLEIIEKKNNENKLVYSPEKVKFSIIKNEILQAEKIFEKLCVARNSIYHSEVIFSKYCNFVALTSFYEYLSAGRCSQLEGHDGAYNLFESEIRANMVIEQLSQVIESLEQIKQNQFMIYNAINDVNSQLENLNNSMLSAVNSLKTVNEHLEHLEDTAEVIAHNTEVTAFYSKKNAELTDALGFMMALK